MTLLLIIMYILDRAVIDQYGINEQYFDCLWFDRSNINILPQIMLYKYCIMLWIFIYIVYGVKYLGILHIPQFYPKSKCGDEISYLLKKSLELSMIV